MQLPLNRILINSLKLKKEIEPISEMIRVLHKLRLWKNPNI
jgi:hypothetical protein